MCLFRSINKYKINHLYSLFTGLWKNQRYQVSSFSFFTIHSINRFMTRD